ncbi:FIG062788: hypothetical protein [hydrothermal vent metagenome]|uniref:Uncharacterized protein n=1 Tax=hydrothermal vent metagenome TaxID=652676 RepID=A0A1W1D4P1_9ZZZZ
MNASKLASILEEDGIIFLTYGGFLTQSLIAGMTEALEKESENADLSMKISVNIFTIFIELSQNMMNYSKSISNEKDKINSKGMIVVGKEKEDYYIMSRNIIDKTDREKIEPKLQQIQQCDINEIKKLYKEVRRSGRDMHNKGGGIGFYEIAKRAKKIEYDFTPINETKFYFKFKAFV